MTDNFKKSWVVFLILIVVTNLLPSSADARLMVRPTPQQLLDEASLVVIATPVSGTVDTSEISTLPGFNHLVNGVDIEPAKVIGVETKFYVAAVLKGDTAIKKITLHHYRTTKLTIINGPNFVHFDSPTQNPVFFLLFLTKSKDGRYEPALGQTDPNSRSIIELNSTDLAYRP